MIIFSLFIGDDSVTQPLAIMNSTYKIHNRFFYILLQLHWEIKGHVEWVER